MGEAFLYGNGGSNKPNGKLTITTQAGATVRITKTDDPSRSYIKTANSEGYAIFKNLISGEYEIYINDGEYARTEYVNVISEYTENINLYRIYGISRDITLSSTEWAREGDAVGKSAVATIGTVAGYSDFDSCYPWSGIERVTLDTGDVMVKIPKFWYKRFMDGTIDNIMIADRPVDGFTLHPAFNHAGVEADYVYVGAYETSSTHTSSTGISPKTNISLNTFRTNAQAKGSGWGVIDISTVSAIQMLILVEFANNNVQNIIGFGYTVQNTSALKTGSCDNIANLTGAPSNNSGGKYGVVWRGIENLWGNTSCFVDGIISSNRQYYVCNDPSKYTGSSLTDYNSTGVTVATNIDSKIITKIYYNESNSSTNYLMVPIEASGGSNTTYYCDTCVMQSGLKIPTYGGTWASGTSAGLFYLYFNQSSPSTGSNLGSRLIYIPQEVQ